MLYQTLYRTVSAAALSAAATAVSPVASQNFTTTSTFPAWLDISGTAGHRTMYDSTGKLTYAPNNMLTQSNTFSNAAWTKTNITVTGSQTDPLGGSNASTLTASGANGTCVQTTAAFISNGQNTLWIKRKTGTGTIQLSKPDGTLTTVSVTSSWAQYTANYQGTGATGDFTIKIVSSGDEIYVYSASQSRVTYETSARSADDVITTSSAYFGPRIDYDPATLNLKGLLTEGSSENLFTYSQGIGGTGWTIFNSLSIAQNSGDTTAPDGTNTATKLTTSNTSKQSVYKAGYTLGTAVYIVSFYVKVGTGSWVALDGLNSDGIGAWYDIANGSVGTVKSGYSAGIYSVGNTGWYRIWLKTPSISIGPSNGFGICVPNADNTTTQTSGQTMYVWGAQFEVGSRETSYIPTLNASITRSADIIKLSGDALTAIGGSAGTVIQEFLLEKDTAATQYQIYGNSVSPLYFDSSRVIKATNGTNELSSSVTATVGTAIRAGLAWDGSGRAISANGGAATTDANGFGTIGSTVYEGSNNGSNAANGWIRTFAIYDSKLSGSTFTDKTTTGAAL